MSGRIYLGLLAAAIAIAAPTARAATIDQQTSEATQVGWDGISDNRWNGQSFAPTMPYLTGVEFFGLPSSHAWNSIPDGTTLSAKVYSTSGGLPVTLLGTATRSTPLGESGWNGPFNFPSPIDVSPYVGVGSSSLFMTWSVPAGVGGEETTSFGGNDYVNGSAFTSTDDGLSWQIIGGRDMTFRTYGVNAVPEPSAVCGLVIAGGCLLRRRSSRRPSAR